jgi:hypothetical protein
LVTLYNALVKPILMFGSTIWSPFFDIHINRIEIVQHRFLQYVAIKLKMTNPRITHDYFQIANILQLNSLESHRIYADVSFLHGILNGLVDCPELGSKISLYENCTSLRSRDLFVIPFNRTSYGVNSPVSRLSKIGNSCTLENLMLPQSQFKVLARNMYLNDFK